MKRTLLFPIVLLCWLPALFTGLTACEKDPETIIQTDTLVIVDTITIIEFQNLPDTATTFILVRHAETTGVGANPGLSAAGQARVEKLTQMLSAVNLNAVYSTNFNRTLQTAQPIATAKGISVTQYDAFAPNALVDNALIAYPSGAVLVVGHSNTTSAMLNAMIGSNVYADLPESEYDNLFIVHVAARGNARVTHLKY